MCLGRPQNYGGRLKNEDIMQQQERIEKPQTLVLKLVAYHSTLHNIAKWQLSLYG